MPQFVIECSESILSIHDAESLIKKIHAAANSTDLFDSNKVQVRINTYSAYSIGNKKQDFIHVFASILEGRNAEQKAKLSKAVGSKLIEIFPDVEIIGVDILDLEKGTGFYRSSL